MEFNKRILKTGALAVVVTVGFWIFAYRAAEWSKGLNSEFVVLGQTTTGGGGGGGSTSGCGSGGTITTCTVTKVIPQVAAGSFGGVWSYSTITEIVNPNATPVTVTGNFYEEDGSPSTLTFGTNLTGANATFQANLTSVSLAANQVLIISAGTSNATTPSSLKVNWGKITATGTISVVTFFELRDTATKALFSRVGVPASVPNAQTFVIPRPHNVASGLDVAFAMVNTGSTAANYTAKLMDASGNTLKTQTGTLAAGQHVAKFTPELFYGGADKEPSLPTGMNFHYVQITGSAPQFAAIALAFEGADQTSFPVDVIQ